MLRRMLSACAAMIGISTCGCAPVPKWDPEQEAKSYLEGMTFADQKSIKLIQFDRWEQKLSTLIFTTESVNFKSSFLRDKDLNLFPSENIVAAIEKISGYKFSNTALKYSHIYGDFLGNEFRVIKVIPDGDRFVCYLKVKMPEAETVPSSKK